MKVLYIINPVAGKGRAKGIAPEIIRICQKNEIKFDLKYTSAPKDATEIARRGTQEGYDRIVSVGGDGTLNEIVNGIAGSSIALGIIPGGTGNDFIRSIQPKLSLTEIINRTIHGEIKRVDLAKSEDMYFINIGSGGFDAEVAFVTNKMKKLFSGSTAYLAALLKTIFTYKSTRIKITIDNLTFEKNTLLVAVANGKYYGGGINPTPEARVDDGIFDICFVEKLPKIKMLLLFPRYMKGTHAGIKGVYFYKGKNVSLSSEEEFAVNIDGEVFLKKDVSFTIIPSGINIIA